MTYTTDRSWVLLDNVAFAMCPDETLARKLAAKLNTQQVEPTLRDHFAMAALAGLLGSPHTQGGDDPAVFIPLLSKLVYRIADEMLAARGGAS